MGMWMFPFSWEVYGVVTLALPAVPEVLRGPFLDRFLFVVVHLVRLAIQCPLGFLLCYRGLSLRFPPLHREDLRAVGAAKKLLGAL